MIWPVWWLAAAAALGMLLSVIARSMDDDIHYVIPAAEVERIENERYQRLESIIKSRSTDGRNIPEPVPER